jgi:hypothetical protein
MSFILSLDESKLEEIIPIISKYEKMITSAEPIFKLEGTLLESALKTLPHYQSSYDQALQEMKGVEEWIAAIKEKKVGKLWKKYNEGYSRQLTARDIQAYIAAEPDVVALNQILVDVVSTKNKLAAIVDALRQMGWMLGHVTKLRVAEMNDAIL